MSNEKSKYVSISAMKRFNILIFQKEKKIQNNWNFFGDWMQFDMFNINYQ